MLQLSDLSSWAFAITTFLTLFLFYKAANKSLTVLIVVLLWMALQAALATSGFFTNTSSIPPRLMLAVLPAMLVIMLLFIAPQGRLFIQSLDIKKLTLLHTIRIPVEIVLFLLFLERKVPQIMTFEGLNFDILSGITAPFILYFGFVKKQLHTKLILLWNFVCLGLLLNIVGIAIFSAPFPFQKLAFDQPNIAVLYFPYIWLPCCVVPLVLLSHLASIYQLLAKKQSH